MRPGSATSRAAERTPEGEGVALDTPQHERLMLLELATDLQRWPARNVVFRRALDRAARDLAKLASETGAR